MTINFTFAELFSFLILTYSLINGLHVSYDIAFATECLDDKYIFHKIVLVSLDQCVLECVRRPGCLAISFCRRFTLCNLLNTDGSEIAFSSKDKDCVFVTKSDMRYNLPPGCEGCKDGQNCDIENEKCTTTECPKLSLDNGLLFGNMNGIGNRVKFKCNSGYRTETGDNYITCEETGNWSITPKCVEECPRGWPSFGESCYKIGETLLNYDNAKAECERDEAHLVHIDDEAENEFIKDLVQSTKFWIGLINSSRNMRARWSWMDNNVVSLFLDWVNIPFDRQPVLPNFRKCVNVNKEGWRTARCDWSYKPICEKLKKNEV